MKIKIVGLIFLITALVLAACSAAATQAPADQETRNSLDIQSESQASGKAALPPGAPIEAPAAVEGANPQPGQADIQALAPMATPLPSSGGLTDVLSQGTGRMVIKDAVMDLLVENTDRSVNEVTDLAATQGGYIISARSWYNNEQKFANKSF